jgi:GT2 family glycosyltransferase
VGITAQPPADQLQEPTRLLDLELSQPLPAASRGPGNRYRRAIALVRLHRIPVGLVPLELPVEPEELARAIWENAGPAVAQHLRADDLPEVAGLTAAGLAPPMRPRCRSARERILARAPAVSVVIATRERVSGLQSCLESLLELDYPRFEIVVVDNAPVSDATKRVVDGMSGARVPVRYVREDRPGLARAHRCALEVIDSELVAFTDDDVLVDRDWLTALAEAFAEAADVACVTGLILPTELETTAQIWLERRAQLNKGFERTVFRQGDGGHDALFPYASGRFGSGANMAFKVEALRAIGGFDVATGVGTPARGGDDLAAFFRVVKSGFALVYEPRALLWHAYRRDLARLRRQMFDYGAGLTAYLTGVLLDDPRVALDLLPRVPRGIRYALSSRSPRNVSSHAPFEQKLIWAERLGMGYGPVGYLRSKRRDRRLRGRVP